MWLRGLLLIAVVTGAGSDAGAADHVSDPKRELDLVGLLDEGVARPIVAASEAEVRQCRDRHAPSRAGRCAVRFLVAEDGLVPEAFIVRAWLSPQLAGSAFEECVLSRVRALRFPPRDGVAWVTYSYVVP